MEGRPVGEIFIGFAYLDTCEVYKFNIPGTRAEIQKHALSRAFLILKKKILKNFKKNEKISAKGPY